MFRLKKVIIFALMTFLLLSSVNVFAADGEISPFYDPGLDGYEFVPSSVRFLSLQTWSHNAYNCWVGRQVTHSCSRTASTSVSSTVEVTVEGLLAEAGVSFEVSIGASVTFTEDVTWIISQAGDYKLMYGNEWVYSYGTEYYWVKGVCKSSKSVNGKWTYSSYSDAQRIN